MARESSLVRNLQKWMTSGGDLSEILGEAEDAPVQTAAEAAAICWALDKHRAQSPGADEAMVSTPLHTLTALFQQVEGRDAFETLKRDGLPRLRVWVEDAVQGKEPREGDVLFVLKVLAMYRQPEDVSLIARAARLPLYPDSYMWSTVLGQFDPEHPHAESLISALSDPLPTGFLLVAFLDMANAQAVAGRLKEHPFDTPQGRQQLEAWLTDPEEEHFSYAHSATVALPFLDPGARGALFRVAREHPDVSVRLEAAWAQVRSGDDSGLASLVRYTLDPSYSNTARSYLEELGHGDKIPEEARAPEFQALAEMAAWLSHPQEYGHPPRQLEVIDSRELFWPPTNDRRRLWLVKYTYDDPETEEPDIGVGMVGSVTFALCGEATADLEPEALYGHHCCWELAVQRDRRAPEERTAENGIRILREHGNTFREQTSSAPLSFLRSLWRRKT